MVLKQVIAGIHGRFGADFHLAKQVAYGVMCRFKLPDGKVWSAKPGLR